MGRDDKSSFEEKSSIMFTEGKLFFLKQLLYLSSSIPQRNLLF